MVVSSAAALSIFALGVSTFVPGRRESIRDIVRCDFHPPREEAPESKLSLTDAARMLRTNETVRHETPSRRTDASVTHSRTQMMPVRPLAARAYTARQQYLSRDPHFSDHAAVEPFTFAMTIGTKGVAVASAALQTVARNTDTRREPFPNARSGQWHL
ncbi:hypothetical protein DOTSEDRAFT_33646 [Dothistroma septosporum NZE10]|uniref:Uncharacterized protein n=1 Tax=Dothistroma septosporum (strain NZE10 / CBS 128990) TaxID=675120 RepID=N1PQ46_DOTSN|nr:hypothetical protein DOTSEDRAFT_33646 [Dothistroma septosporum NZE10]